MSTERFRHVNALIDNGDIDVARMVLQNMDNVQARSWLERLDELLQRNKPESLGKLVAEIPYRTRKHEFRLLNLHSFGLILLIGGIGGILLGAGMIAGMITFYGFSFVVLDMLERAVIDRLDKLPPLQLREGGLVITKGEITHVLGWASTRFQFIQSDENPDRIRIFADNGAKFEFSDEIQHKAWFINRVKRESTQHKTILIHELAKSNVEPLFKTERGKEPEWILYLGLITLAVIFVFLSFLFEGEGSAKDLFVRMAVTIPASHMLQKLIFMWDKRQRPYCYQIHSAGIEAISKAKQRHVNWRDVSGLRVKRDKIRLSVINEPDFTVDIGSNYTGLLDGHVIHEWTLNEARPYIVQRLLDRLTQGEMVNFRRFSITKFGIETNTLIEWQTLAAMKLDRDALGKLGIVWTDDEWNALTILPIIRHFTTDSMPR